MFDLDGTLLPFVQEDFVSIYFAELCKKLAPLGYEPKPTVKAVWAGTAAMVKNDGSRLNSEAFWEVFRALNESKPDAKKLCDEFYTQEFDKARACLKYIPDRKPMIERLKANGLRLVLATNPLFPLDGVLTRLSWAGLSSEDFVLITHYDNCTHCKPNLKYYEDILKTIGAAPDECVMIGNSVQEDMCAEELGIAAFLIEEFVENPENSDLSKFNRGTFEDAERFVLERLNAAVKG